LQLLPFGPIMAPCGMDTRVNQLVCVGRLNFAWGRIWLIIALEW